MKTYRLVKEARYLRMEKQALIGGLVAGHIAQNTVGRQIAKNKGFKSGVAKSFAMGAAGKQSPRSVAGYAKDAVSAVAAPERNLIRNEAYDKGRELRHKLPKNMSKRDLATARMALTGDHAGLKRTGKSKSPIAQHIRKHLPDGAGLRKEYFRDIQKLPDGKRKPSSGKVGILANAAIAPVAPDMAALNVGKLATNTKAISNTKLMKKVRDKVVSQPLKNSLKAGSKGYKWSEMKNRASSILVNPFTAEAEKDAFKAGSKLSRK